MPHHYYTWSVKWHTTSPSSLLEQLCKRLSTNKFVYMPKWKESHLSTTARWNTTMQWLSSWLLDLRSLTAGHCVYGTYWFWRLTCHFRYQWSNGNMPDCMWRTCVWIWPWSVRYVYHNSHCDVTAFGTNCTPLPLSLHRLGLHPPNKYQLLGWVIIIKNKLLCLQCFDTIGCLAGRVSSL